MNPHSTSPTKATDIRLSVVVITRNEAHNLPRLLGSIQGLAEEVIVFDSGSTDGTVTLAKNAGARVTPCEWTGWSDTKNRANATARGQWILSLDADEALTPTCAAAIRAFIAGPTQTESGAWRVGEINRLTRYVDHWVRHSGWHPDLKVRLWPAGAGSWLGNIHESLVFDGPTEVVRMDGVVEHHSFPTVASHLHQIERFGKAWAEGQFNAGRRSHIAVASIKVVAQWIKTAWIRGGFRDGTVGWAIARRSAWATWRKHALLRAMYRPQTPPRRVLIARTDALGDVVCTLPMVQALRKRHPEVMVDLLVRPYAAPVAACSIGVNEVVQWTPECVDDPKGRGEQGLSKGQYDAVVMAFPDQAVIRAAQAARIPIRIGTGRRLAAFRLTHRLWDSRKHSGGHEAWHGLRLLQSLGVDAPDLRPTGTFLTAPPSSPQVETWLDRLGPTFVLLHPGSHGSAGNARPEDVAQWAHQLADAGVQVGLTGTAKEGAAFAEYLPEHRAIHSLFGALSLEELLALQSHASLVMASSTGPLHTASALGIPVVGVYHTSAPAWPERWAPIGPNAQVVLTDRLTSDGHLALDSAEVLRVARQVLATSG